MKTIGFSIPCYNEEKNIPILYEEITKMMQNELPNYNYIIQFIDNASTDNTQKILEEICEKDKKVRAVFNLVNIALYSAVFNMMHIEGDCVIYMYSDLQDPVSLIPQFVKEWEAGSTLVLGIKNSSEENKFMYFLRSTFYKLYKKVSHNKTIEQFAGFGLYDREFVEIMSKNMDMFYPLRYFVAQYGYNVKFVYYNQPKRKYGKSNVSIFQLFCYALSLLVGSTTIGVHAITLLGGFLAVISFLVSIFYFVCKIINWNSMPIGIAPAVIGIFLFGSIQTFFLGLIGEYILDLSGKLVNDRKLIIRKTINIENTESYSYYLMR